VFVQSGSFACHVVFSVVVKVFLSVLSGCYCVARVDTVSYYDVLDGCCCIAIWLLKCSEWLL